MNTPIGEFWFLASAPSSTRVGVSNIEQVDNWGPESTYRWSLDQEEALFATAREVGARLELYAPGGWELMPPTAYVPFQEALQKRTAGMKPTGRKTEKR